MMISHKKIRLLSSERIFLILLIFIVTCGVSCSSKPPVFEPPAPKEEENLLSPFLEDGVPVELISFSNPFDGFQSHFVEEGHTGKKSLLIEGAGDYGGVNVGRVKLEGRKTYIATVYTHKIEGRPLLKIDYYQNEKYLGSTNSFPAKLDGWQHLTVLSQRSRFPKATHLLVVAVCRGASKARFDDFALEAR